MKNRTLAFLSLIWMYPVCSSQTQPAVPYQKSGFPCENMEKLVVEPGILGESKDVFVGLPDGYNDTTRYPLVLVLEGEVLFESFAPLTRLMGEVGEIPACIVAGIPLNDRHLDYAPRISGYPESGHADTMLEFYRRELFPLLDSLYHLTTDRIIWAHSGLGGIFCTYLLLGPDNQFTGILSSSPNLRWLQEYIQKENAFGELSRKQRIFYYLSFGGNEAEAYMGEMYRQVRAFADKLESEAPGNLVWKYQFNENNNHFTNAIETYVEGLTEYFRVMQ